MRMKMIILSQPTGAMFKRGTQKAPIIWKYGTSCRLHLAPDLTTLKPSTPRSNQFDVQDGCAARNPASAGRPEEATRPQHPRGGETPGSTEDEAPRQRATRSTAPRQQADQPASPRGARHQYNLRNRVLSKR